MYVTKHGRKRIKERCGVRNADRFIQIVLDKGLQYSDTTGSLKKYLDYLYSYNLTANNIRLYGEKIYIFCDEILITVYNTPRKYKEIVRKLAKEKGNV